MSLLQEKLLKLAKESNQGVKDLSRNEFKTYAEIYKNSEKYLNELSQLSQEVISVVLPNSTDYLEVMLSCLMTGNIFNPIPYFTSDEELNRIFDYVEPKLLITDRTIEGLPSNLLYLSPSDVKKNSFNPDTSYRDIDIEGSDIASLYYSSGTTGSPKGVLYSHDNVHHLISSINRGFGFSKNSKHLSILPFGHTASINYNIFPCFYLKSPLVIAESFSSIAPRFFKIISQESINYVQVVPTVVYMLLKIKYKIEDLDLSSLEFVGCGSSILPLESQLEFHRKFNIKIGNLYGLSETGPTHIDDPREDNWSPGTIGIPLDVNECMISDSSEILIKGKNVFVGYYKNDKLYNQSVIDQWFYTGDVGLYRDGKYIYKDRSKDLIIKGGINIVPAEVEEILYMEKEILEAAVIGIADDVHGEEVIAAVALKDSSEDTDVVKKRLYELLSRHLSSYKHPVDIIFLETLPKTHSGKLKRREVRNKIKDVYN